MKKWLTMPLWAVQIFTQTKSFTKNPILGNTVLNRCGLHVFRIVLAHGIMRFRMLVLSTGIDPAHRQEFFDNGYILIRDFLDPRSFDTLKQEIQEADGEVRECIQGDTLTHRILLEDSNTAQLPACHSFFQEPRLKKLLRFASGKFTPPVSYIQTIKNHYTEGADDPQKNLHSDTFHPTMKSWYFIDDVTSANGPFTYSPGSHRLTWKRLSWEYRRSIEISRDGDRYAGNGSLRAQAADVEAMGLNPPQGLAVPANTLVIANTHGFHCRGQASEKSTRTELWTISRNNPFNPLPGIDHPVVTRLQNYALKRWRRYCDQRASERGTVSSWHVVESRNTIR